MHNAVPPVLKDCLRLAGLAVLSGAIAFGLWAVPQYTVVLNSHRLGHLIDYHLAVFLVESVLLALLCLLLRAPLVRLSVGPPSADGLRSVAWFTVGALMFSLLVSFTILMSNPASSTGIEYSWILQRWRSEFHITGLAGHFAVVFVLAPALEELVFRGLILGFLLRTSPRWLGLSISTLLFAAFHSNWMHAAFAGFVYGLVYLRYQSLLLSWLAHAAKNFLVVGMATLFVAYLGEGGYLVAGMPHLLPLQIVWLLVVIACFVVFFRALFAGTPRGWFRMTADALPSTPDRPVDSPPSHRLRKPRETA